METLGAKDYVKYFMVYHGSGPIQADYVGYNYVVWLDGHILYISKAAQWFNVVEDIADKHIRRLINKSKAHLRPEASKNMLTIDADTAKHLIVHEGPYDAYAEKRADGGWRYYISNKAPSGPRLSDKRVEYATLQDAIVLRDAMNAGAVE